MSDCKNISFQGISSPLVVRCQHSQDNPACNGMRYHPALPEFFIQPPCYALCVLMGQSEGWAIVHGLEGLNLYDVNRASLFLNCFCFGVGKGVVHQWPQNQSTEEM